MRRAWVVLAVGCALAAGGCSASSGNAAGAAVADAADAAQAAGSARMEMTMDFGVGAFTASGLQQFDPPLGRLTMDFGPLAAAFGGDAASFPSSIEMIVDGSIIYMEGSLFAAVPGGPDVDWIKIDSEALASSQLGVDLGQLQSLQGNNPSQYLAFLEGVSTDSVTEVGTEAVRGTPTTHYRATVDLEAVYAEAGAVADQGLFDQFLENLPSGELPMDVWLDPDGLPRRVSFELASPPEAGGASIEMTIEFFDYGVEVDVSPPEGAVDLLELLGGTAELGG